jgi:hypothetical protein
VRHRDASGDPGTTNSNWDVRLFRTRTEDLPTAAGWVAKQAGYEVQEIPFVFGAGESDWRLPANMAFVPESRHGTRPGDPFFYVHRAWGQIRVVTNDYHVFTYASGVLNYNPTGSFPGSGEKRPGRHRGRPTNGDVYATMLYDDLTDGTTNTFPKVTRYTSTDGGLHAVDTSSTLAGTQGHRHPADAQRADAAVAHGLQHHLRSRRQAVRPRRPTASTRPRGRTCTRSAARSCASTATARPPPTTRTTARPTAGNDGKPDPTDYWFANGLRNPCGGAWRAANPAAGTPRAALHVENGPSRDRLHDARPRPQLPVRRHEREHE